MAETQIEWTDATWNPVAGCSIVTAGCTHCYAMEMAKRLEAMGMEKYAGLTRKTGRRTVWNGVVREDRGSLAIPHGWRKPRKIFVNSMSDLFHEQVSDAFILDVWQVMREAPRHNYQILTKRPERMAELVAGDRRGTAQCLARNQHRGRECRRQDRSSARRASSDPLHFLRAADRFRRCC
jgi:protein gp37